MKARNGLKAGFTLVEILIVVVILGILAAIVIPQFTSASESAKASSLVSQLQTIRSQLELYQVQHNGSYPPEATFWTKMTTKTDVNGAAIEADDTTTPSYGPYLQQPSTNPFQNSSAVSGGAEDGWSYDEDTGAIKAVMTATVYAKAFPGRDAENDSDIVIVGGGGGGGGE